MRKRSFFAALLALLVVSMVFLSCDPKEDDNTTNPTSTTNIVKEVYGFYNMPTAKAKSILEKKGWIKKVIPYGAGAEILYYSPDTTKSYYLISKGDTITYSSYGEKESSFIRQTKLAENFGRFLQTFEKWEPLIYNIKPSDATYEGYIYANEGEYEQNCSDRAAFLAEYNTKKTTLIKAISGFRNEKIYGKVTISLDYYANNTLVYIEFGLPDFKKQSPKTTPFPKGIKENNKGKHSKRVYLITKKSKAK
jgi:hypothetical protein